MGLQFILGSSGSGKSYQLYQHIIKESMEKVDTNYFVLVPEQFTMQTQKDFVEMHTYHGISNIDILSFLRLAHRVFEETGEKNRIILEDTGKNMVIRKIVEERKSNLCLFQLNIKKQGFIEELKSFISELLQYSIGMDELKELILHVEKKPMLQGKLKDILEIYEGFKTFLEDKYITAEEILDILYEVIEQSSFIQNSVFCFDGFTGFTPSQYKLLAKIMKLAKQVYVTITIDKREDISKIDEEFQLFHLSKKTIQKLSILAKEQSILLLPNWWAGENNIYRFQGSKALEALEHNLFRYPSKIFTKNQEDIEIIVAKDPIEEVLFTIQQIKILMKEKNYRYKDIAVVTGDIEQYGRIVEKEYEEEKIPCFIDQKKDILQNPMVELIRSVLELIDQQFSYESVFRYLRTGFLKLDKVEIDKLENYVIALGIRGQKRWSEEWTRSYPSKAKVNLGEINATRFKVIDSVSELCYCLKQKDGTVESFTRALYSFLVKLNVFEVLIGYQQKFEVEGKRLKAKEYEQIYQIVLDLLDKIVELLGTEQLALKEYTEILDAGFKEAEVGLIPPGMDQILVGDIERTRLKDIKVLFFIGVNDGIIPKTVNHGGVLSELEREFLLEYQIELAPTRRQSAYIDQFYYYLNLTKPQNKLYLTYSKLDSNGKTLRTSYLVHKVIKLFPKIRIIDLEREEQQNLIDYELGKKDGIYYLANGLREYDTQKRDNVWNELFRYYQSNEKYRKRVVALLEGVFYENNEEGLSKAVAHAIYGKELYTSVSRLEKYAACAYAHFLVYGLELEERKQFQLAIPDLGTIFHSTIDLFSRKLQDSIFTWGTIPDKERNELVGESVIEAVSDYNRIVLQSSKRNEYMLERIERIAKRTIWALCEHMKQSDFEADGYELQFSHLDNLESVTIPLSKEEVLRLKGRIDRIDTMEKGEEVYIKVIDYKSGNTTFDVVSFFYGLQMQLVIYLNAAMELENKKYPSKKMIPAGIFYYNMDDPLIERQRVNWDNEISEEDKKQIELELLKELKMNGIVNETKQALIHLDKTLEGSSSQLKPSVKSFIIPVETNKEGEITKSSSTASDSQFTAISHFVKKKISHLGEEMLDGNITIAPYKIREKTACDYCKFHSICAFDLKLPGNQYHTLKKLEKDVIWELIEEGNDADD